VRVAASAEADFRNIIDWTLQEFGAIQARIYADTLTAAIAALAAGPTAVGSRERNEIGKGMFVLHGARGGRKGRHFVLFRADKPARRIEVLRLLHDSMDLGAHSPDT
jgi:toxin ParE1/3/4